MKTPWNEKPLKDLDLLKIVKEEQKRDPNLTKMDIFRVLSKKYKKILTADQFNFRYNYLMGKQRKQEAIKQSNEHKHYSGKLPDVEITPLIIPRDELNSKPQIPTGEYKRYSMINHELRDKNQKLLNINKALWEMIDPHKLVKFCNTQLELQKRRKCTGGFNIIFKTLAEVFDQKQDTVSSRFYVTRKQMIDNKNTKAGENQILLDKDKQINELQNTIIILTTDNNDLKKEIKDLEFSLAKEINNKTLESELNSLKNRPLVKISLFIKNIEQFFKREV